MLKRIFQAFTLIVLLCAMGSAQNQASFSQTFTATGTSNSIGVASGLITGHKITWLPVGTVSTCTVAIDSSVDGVSWTAGGLMPATTCTSAGSFTVGLITGFIRINLSTLSGGGSLVVSYGGQNNPNQMYPTLPASVLGCYQINGRTNVYGGLSAGNPLFSFRWAPATAGAIAIVNHVKVSVIATVAATTAGQAERELIRYTGSTVADSGGTAITPLSSNNKLRSTFANSLVNDIRSGSAISAGTRTLDANPFSSAIAWLPLNMTGVDVGCNGAGPTGAVWSCVGGGTGYIDLLNATNGQDYPLVLGNQEGFLIRIGKDAMPSGASQQTYFTVEWCEANPF